MQIVSESFDESVLGKVFGNKRFCVQQTVKTDRERKKVRSLHLKGSSIELEGCIEAT